MTPEERLAELGLALPPVATPVAAYVPAVRTGSYVFTSGQLPLRDGALIRTGKVGAEVSPDQAYECARQCALNALAAVRSQVGDLSAITRVVKVVGFVSSVPDFTGQPQVVTVIEGRRGEGHQQGERGRRGPRGMHPDPVPAELHG